MTCPSDWYIGGTGHSHPYPYQAIDEHTVTFRLETVNGTMDLTVFPDTGL